MDNPLILVPLHVRRWLLIIVGFALVALAAVVFVRGGDVGHEHAAPTNRSSDAPGLDRFPLPRRDDIGRHLADNEEVPRLAIRGRVICDGVATADASVYARLPPDTTAAAVAPYAASVLAKSTTDATGEYELELPDRTAPYSVDVGCVANGALRELRQGVSVDEGMTRVDFNLTRGSSIRGVALQRNGVPVPNLTILATRKNIMDPAGALGSPDLLDTTKELYADRNSDYHESRGTTDARGAFALSGLAQGRYVLTTDSFTWLPDPMLDVRTEDGDVLFTVVGAQGVTGSVVDATTGDPIPNFLVDAALLKGEEEDQVRSGVSMNGALRLSWVPSSNSPLDAMVRVAAQGYVTAHKRVALARAGLADTGVWELARTAAARVILAIRYDDGAPFVRPVQLEYVQSRGAIRGSTVLTINEPGVYEGTMPPGQWFVRVRPTSWLGAVGAWRSEVRIRDKDEWHATVTIPLGADVTVDLPDGPGWSIMARSTFMTSSCDPEQRQTVFHDFPPGRWELRLCRDGAVQASKTIDVQRGGQHDVSFR